MLNILITILAILLVIAVWNIEDGGIKLIVFFSLFFPTGLIIFYIIDIMYEKAKEKSD
jgi:prepilin signal peptidase PulO-like enzyme (type II secretory pathway)